MHVQKSSRSPDPLLKLLKSKESERLEFKVTLSSPFKAAKEMAALANTAGGRLIVGVDDRGSVVGVISPQAEEALLRDAASNCCSPPLNLSIKTVSVEGKTVIDVCIPPSRLKHVIRDQRGNELVYVRVKDKNLLASKKTVKQFESGPQKKISSKQFDRHEKKLVEYLKEHERITLQEFSHCANISRRRAARILVKLERASFIRSHDFEKKTFYTLNPDKGH